MERSSVDIPFPGNFLGIANKAIKNLSDQECDDMASFYYDRYLWSSDDKDDLYRAAIYQYMKRTRSRHSGFINKVRTVDEVLVLWKENDGTWPFVNKNLDDLADREFKKTF